MIYDIGLETLKKDIEEKCGEEKQEGIYRIMNEMRLRLRKQK